MASGDGTAERQPPRAMWKLRGLGVPASRGLSRLGTRSLGWPVNRTASLFSGGQSAATNGPPTLPRRKTEMRPLVAGMETGPLSGDFSSVPIRKCLLTCRWPMNQVSSHVRNACREALRGASNVPEAPISPPGSCPPTLALGKGGTLAWPLSHHPPSLRSLGGFFENPQHQPSAPSPAPQSCPDLPGFLPRFIIERSRGDFPNQ